MGVRESFPFQDRNVNGTLTGRDNATLISDLNEAFDTIDTNDDTVVDFAEFQASNYALYTRNRENPSEYSPLEDLMFSGYFPVSYRVILGEMQAC